MVAVAVAIFGLRPNAINGLGRRQRPTRQLVAEGRQILDALPPADRSELDRKVLYELGQQDEAMPVRDLALATGVREHVLYAVLDELHRMQRVLTPRIDGAIWNRVDYDTVGITTAGR